MIDPILAINEAANTETNTNQSPPNNSTPPAENAVALNPEPVPVVSAPEITKPDRPLLADGKNKGEIQIAIRRMPGAVSYIHQYIIGFPVDDTVWMEITTSKNTHLYTNLTSGVRYYFRIVVIDANNHRLYSDDVTQMCK